jgi:hypothetical protein
MASTTDATYQPRVYREHGGENLIIATSGHLYVQSGGCLHLEAGSSASVDTNLEFGSGYYVKRPVTSRTAAQKTTAIPLGSICSVVASTTIPEYILATPVAGSEITVISLPCTASATCKVYSGTTSILMGGSSQNMVTLTGAECMAHFSAASATRWYVLKNTTVAFGVHTS